MGFAGWLVWWSARVPGIILLALVLSFILDGPADLNAGLMVAGFLSVLWFVFICCVGLLIRVFAPPRMLAKIDRVAPPL